MPTATSPSPAPVDVGADSLVEVLRRVLRGVRHRTAPSPSSPLLAEAEVEVLGLVESHGECRVGEAAAELRLAANTVSSVVTRLVVAGLLTRTPDRRDRRAARLGLTAAGTRRLEAWRDRRRAVVVEALGALADADRAAVLAALPALDRLADAMGDDDG